MTSRTHYEVLGVPEHCSGRDIRKAYLKLALIFHDDKVRHRVPDGHTRESALEEFKLINAANETLSDVRLRLTYDRHLEFRREEVRAEAEKKKAAEERRKEEEELRRRNKRKIDLSETLRSVQIYFGSVFRTCDLPQATVPKWVNANVIAVLTTLECSVDGLAGIIHRSNQMLPDGKKIDFDVDEFSVFVAVQRGATAATPRCFQSLLPGGAPASVQSIEAEMLKYLRARDWKDKDVVNVILFKKRANGSTTNSNSSGTRNNTHGSSSSYGAAAETCITFIFGGIRYKNSFFVDASRSAKSAKSVSEYISPRKFSIDVRFSDVIATVAELSRELDKDFAISSHLVLRVTGNRENLSTSSTPHMYLRCCEPPPASLVLPREEHMFAVIVRNTPDIGIACASGSRHYTGGAGSSAAEALRMSTIQGLKYRLLVLLRQGKNPPCLESFCFSDNTPSAVEKSLEELLHMCAATVLGQFDTARSVLLRTYVSAWSPPHPCH